MKNVLPVIALLLSVSGIAVSLGREEVRCHLGLESAICPKEETQDTAENTSTVSPETPTTETENTPPTETTRNIEPSPEVSPSPETETPIEFTPTPENSPLRETENSSTADNKTEEKNSHSENIPEVNKSSDRESESIPLEVIPPQQ
jgi:hypothetical protein